MSQTQRWPKAFAPLTPEQEAIRDDFVKRALEVLPRRYGAIERFNHEYSVRTWADRSSKRTERSTRTLEVGAGLGAHIAFEDLRVQEYYALEMRENVLSVLKGLYPQVHAVSGSIEERTTFSSGFFDRIVVVHVLEHLCNLPKALDEIRRLLAPDGELSVVAPCEGGLAYAFARRISAQRMFEKTYRSPYRWFIEREHVNTYPEIRAELMERFRITHEQRWPLPGLPVDVNLAVGLTLIAK
jgi:SAM-dependent methyltransferase